MKTNIFKYVMVLLLCLSAWSNTCGQNQGRNYKDVIPPTPQTATMIRYGHYDTQLFKGDLNLSIPIYTIEDIDFNLPIALNYHSDGFKPRQASGYVGQNWFLQAGGCIHREVKGTADEAQYYAKYIRYGNEGVEQSSARQTTGMYIYAQEHSHTINSIFNFSSSVYTSGYSHAGDKMVMLCTNPNNSVDYQPDIYHFNFCGYSGSFTINNTGKPIIIRGDFVEIDLSNFSDIDNDREGIFRRDSRGFPCPNPDSKIILRTLDGYTYTFGGNIAALEYTLILPSDEEFCNRIVDGDEELRQANRSTKPITNSWYLTSIKAPNGREMLFTYYDAVKSSDEDYDGSSVWELKQIYSPVYERDPNKINPIHEEPYSALLWARQALLSSITIPDTEFEIDLKTTKKHSLFGGLLSSYNDDNRLLDSIAVTCGNTTLRTAKVTYLTISNDAARANFWHYLQRVRISGVGAYEMEYNTPSGYYPDLMCPDAYYYTNEANTEGYTSKSNKILLGTIEKITYPTGGYQTFQFAPHTYHEQQYFKYVPASTPQFSYQVVSGSSNMILGCRIDQVKTFDRNDQLIETHDYQYNNGVFFDPIPHEGQSAFMLIHGARHSIYNTTIAYKDVTVTKTLSSGKTETTTYNFFTGPTQTKNNLYDESVINIYRDVTSIATSRDLAESGFLFHEPLLMHVGTLMAENVQIKDIDNTVATRKTTYVYNGIPRSTTEFGYPLVANKTYTADNEKIAMFARVMNFPVTRILTYQPQLLLQKEEIYETETGEQLTLIGYEYDKKKRLTGKFLKGSDWRVDYERYTYPDNIPNIQQATGYGAGYRKMIEKKQLLTPVETVQGYRELDSVYVTAGTLSVYSAENGTLRQTAKLGLTAAIKDYQYLSANGTNPVAYDPRYYTTCNYVFNDDNRLLSVQPIGQPATTYTWTGIYPTAKTTLDRTITYSYIPYVGINTITDENGETTYYLYDTEGRLIQVYRMRNGQKEILEAFNYNIISECKPVLEK